MAFLPRNTLSKEFLREVGCAHLLTLEVNFSNLPAKLSDSLDQHSQMASALVDLAVVGSILPGTTSKSRLCRPPTTTPSLPGATAVVVVVGSVSLKYFDPPFRTEALAGDDFLWKLDLHVPLP